MAEPRPVVTLLADTFVPRVERAASDAETRAFLRRTASDLGLPELLAASADPRHEPVLAALEARGFCELDLDGRTRTLHELGAHAARSDSSFAS